MSEIKNQTENKTSDNQSPESQRLTLEYRETSMGGLTLPLGLKVDRKEVRVVTPIWREYSRTGRHGRWTYRVEDLDVALLLLQSNSGKRSVRVIYARSSPDVDRIISRVKSMWLDGYSYDEVRFLL